MGQTPDLGRTKPMFWWISCRLKNAYIAGIVDFPGESTILMPCSMLWVFPLLASIFYKDQIKTTSAQNLPQFPQKILVNWSHLSILSHGLSYGFFHGNNASRSGIGSCSASANSGAPAKCCARRPSPHGSYKIQGEEVFNIYIYMYIYILMVYIYT